TLPFPQPTINEEAVYNALILPRRLVGLLWAHRRGTGGACHNSEDRHRQLHNLSQRRERLCETRHQSRIDESQVICKLWNEYDYCRYYRGEWQTGAGHAFLPRRPG